MAEKRFSTKFFIHGFFFTKSHLLLHTYGYVQGGVKTTHSKIALETQIPPKTIEKKIVEITHFFLTFLTKTDCGIAKKAFRKVTRPAILITLLVFLLRTHQAAWAVRPRCPDTLCLKVRLAGCARALTPQILGLGQAQHEQ